MIVLTIDENGMAKTRDHKLAVAKRIYDIAVNDHGLKPEDLVFDTLTFTLATGDPEFNESAIETIEGIRLIKENLPGVLTSLGVSNLSFGFSAHARPAAELDHALPLCAGWPGYGHHQSRRMSLPTPTFPPTKKNWPKTCSSTAAKMLCSATSNITKISLPPSNPVSLIPPKA